jgi:Uma2 family endonuclease
MSTTLLTGIRWETYESLLCDFQDRSGPRLAYDNGNLEIMSPLPEHERRKDVLVLLVNVVAEERGIDLQSFGSTTYRRADIGRGFEPDGCFYIQSVGELPEDLGGLDVATLPPPDLIIEVDATHSSLEKLPLYAEFGIREVWRDAGERVEILVPGDAGFVESEESLAFPGLNAETLTRFVADSQRLTRLTWLRQVRAWARGAETV